MYWILVYVSPLTLSPSLSPSLPFSLTLFFSHLGDSSVHAASNVSRCLSGCSVYALCATLFSSPLSYALYGTALHCTALLSSALLFSPLVSSHLHLSSVFLLFLYLHPSHSHTLLSLLCIAALCSFVWENTVHSGLFCVRAEYAPAFGRRGFRCSWCSRFGLYWTLWVWRRGQGGRGEWAKSCPGESFICVWK